MQWRRVADGPDERTEIYEFPSRGCLVRVSLKVAGTERWSTQSVAFCAGLTADELAVALAAPGVAASAPAPEPAPPAPPVATPAPAAPPAPTAPTPETGAAPVAAPEAAPAPAPEVTAAPEAAPASAPAPEAASASAPAPEAAPAAPAPAVVAADAIEVMREYAQLRDEVIREFRSKVGVSSGPIGFLDHLPQVGSFRVPNQGDWVWRIDVKWATLKSKKRILELPIPDHSRDDAIDIDGLSHYLEATERSALAFDGAAYPGDPKSLAQLIRKMELAKKLVMYSRHPKPVYIVK